VAGGGGVTVDDAAARPDTAATPPDDTAATPPDDTAATAPDTPLPPTTIAATVVDVHLDPPGVTDGGLVLLQETPPPNRYLRIIVGRYEAVAIARAFHGAPQTRPAAWDLFLETLDLLHVRLVAVTITRVQERRHFFAELELDAPAPAGAVDRARIRHRLDARPSDALALAARREWVEIRIAPEVLDAAGIEPGAAGPERRDETELN
jgi:bifunctional DNase/RNase